jgi:hypothetical protein
MIVDEEAPFSLQSCRSCYATPHLCQRSFYKIFVKFRNSKKNVLKNVLIIVNINKDENKANRSPLRSFFSFFFADHSATGFTYIKLAELRQDLSRTFRWAV